MRMRKMRNECYAYYDRLRELKEKDHCGLQMRSAITSQLRTMALVSALSTNKQSVRCPLPRLAPVSSD